MASVKADVKASVASDQIDHDQLDTTATGLLSHLSLGPLDITSDAVQLAGLEDDLDDLASHDLLQAVLDKGIILVKLSKIIYKRLTNYNHCCSGADPREFGREYESKLHIAELKAIEDYISESENLEELHGKVC